MSWSYSGDPSTGDKDEYRFLIGDTDESDQLLSDEEIEYTLAKTTKHNNRLYILYQTIANGFAKEIKSSLGPQSEDPTKRNEYYSAMAKKYGRMITGGIPSTVSSSDDTVFVMGIHDNE